MFVFSGLAESVVGNYFVARKLFHLNANVAVGCGIIFSHFSFAERQNVLSLCAGSVHLSFLVSLTSFLSCFNKMLDLGHFDPSLDLEGYNTHTPAEISVP
jgi:hypothetical protein